MKGRVVAKAGNLLRQTRPGYCGICVLLSYVTAVYRSNGSTRDRPRSSRIAAAVWVVQWSGAVRQALYGHCA